MLTSPLFSLLIIISYKWASDFMYILSLEKKWRLNMKYEDKKEQHFLGSRYLTVTSELQDNT
jgi:hypothetical protein